MNLLKKLFNPKFKGHAQYPFRVIPAFEMNGVTYYEIENVFDIPCMRALSAIKYYEEMRMKCNMEYLTAWSDAQANIIKQAQSLFTVANGRLNLTAISAKLNELELRNVRLKERLDLALDIELVYKLASVVYFDDTESPYQYDQRYGMKKIDLWKKSEGTHDFFLRAPIKKLVPFLDGQEEHIQTFQLVAEKVKEMDLSEVLSKLSNEQKMNYTKATS